METLSPLVTVMSGPGLVPFQPVRAEPVSFIERDTACAFGIVDRVKILHDGNTDPIRKKVSMAMSKVFRRDMEEPTTEVAQY
jgi:hypothetical protein